MAGAEIARYASDVVATLDRALGPAAPSAELTALSDAANDLVGLADNPTVTAAEWQAAVNAWQTARDNLASQLRAFLLDGLPDVPGLEALAKEVGWDDAEGLHGQLDIGPVHLTLASASLVIQPPAISGPTPTTLPPLVIGPFKPGAIGASIKPPIGGDGKLPGGGAVVRLPDGSGFGGTLQLPLGPVAVDAAAILARLPDGTPSFLAVLGVTFTPPIQLSFGFSLDRVGGIVGVNRRVDTDALALAVRTGAAGNALFAVAPPANPAALVGDLDRFFPPRAGRHVVGPTLRLAWVSFGDAGSFVSLDLGVVVELPTGKVVILGVARAGIPSLPGVIQLRLDVLGVVDPVAQLVSVDASLVDSHVLGIFGVYGDAGLRVSWGSQAYTVLSIGGFYPGFNPEPAHLPALRRVGMAAEIPLPVDIRAEGYFAVTSNTVQLGARYEATITTGLTAHGFLQVDALVQFRPFHFVANCAAGFDVGVAGCSFAGVRLDGTVSGPGPITIHGRLTIETFLFDISWDETFTLGSGPGDVTKRQRLLDVMAEELDKPGNLHADQQQDPAVVLEPRVGRPKVAVVPPAGTLCWSQRRAPLGFRIDRVDGQPLDGAQGVVVASPGAAVADQFSPGSYCTLTDSEALHRAPFDKLQSGVFVPPGTAATPPPKIDNRLVEVIVILGGTRTQQAGARTPLAAIDHLVAGSRRAPALSSSSPLVTATRETWAIVGPAATSGLTSATAAHQLARGTGSVAVADVDAAQPVDLASV